MTTEVHVHHWVLEPYLTRDVPAQCACGAARVFGGMEPDAEDRFRQYGRRK